MATSFIGREVALGAVTYVGSGTSNGCHVVLGITVTVVDGRNGIQCSVALSLERYSTSEKFARTPFVALAAASLRRVATSSTIFCLRT